MATAEELTERRKNAIKKRMERTRARLASRLNALGETVHEVRETVNSTVETVQSTVESVQDTVQSTVESVQSTVSSTVETARDALDIRKHPMLWLGGSVVAGYLGGRWLHSPSKPQAPATYPAGLYYPPTSPAAAPAVEPPQEKGKESGLLGSLGGLVGNYVDQVKGMGIGAAIGLLRDLVAREVPPDLRDQVTEIGNNLIEELGGQVLDANLIDPDFLTGERKSEPEEEPVPRKPEWPSGPACQPEQPVGATRI